MDVNTQTDIVGIIAICAIFSPILTTLINNLHTLISNYINNNQKRKQETINNFIVASLNCITHYEYNNKHTSKPSNDLLLNYYICLDKFIYFFPKYSKSKNLTLLTNNLRSGDAHIIQKNLVDLLMELKNKKQK